MKTDYTVNDLRERIILEKADITVDAELNRIPTYVPMRMVYAAMIPQRPVTTFTGVVINAQVKYTVVIRKQPLEAKIERITWNAEHYYPVSPWVETKNLLIGEFSVEVPGNG